jgi:hypothetical protein
MTNAISCHSDGIHVSAKLDDYGTNGTFLLDGTVVHGTLGTCPQNLFAFKVWFQLQDTKLSISQSKLQWNNLNPNKQI